MFWFSVPVLAVQCTTFSKLDGRSPGTSKHVSFPQGQVCSTALPFPKRVIVDQSAVVMTNRRRHLYREILDQDKKMVFCTWSLFFGPQVSKSCYWFETYHRGHRLSHCCSGRVVASHERCDKSRELSLLMHFFLHTDTVTK